MKNYTYLFLVVIYTSLTFIGCSDDDDNLPEIVSELEEITTVILTISPEGSEDTFVFQSQDIDGDGPNPPVMTVPDQNLQANTMYTGFINVWNEAVDPVSNETLEIIEEADVHQFFYTPGGDFNFTEFNYLDQDINGLPLGVEFNFTTGEAQEGTLTVLLRHDLVKVNTNNPTDVGGETEVDVTFPVTVE